MLKRFIFIFCALFILAAPLVSCKEDGVPQANPSRLPRLTLHDGNIIFWSPMPEGVGVQMTEQGREELHALTKANTNKPIAIYVGDIWAATPVVHEPITDGRLLISADQDRRKLDMIIGTLPALKRR